MLVQCPKCRTTYKVSDEVMKGAAPAFRCSRCKHTFELDADVQVKPTKPSSEPVEQINEAQPEKELTFSFNPTQAESPSTEQDFSARKSQPEPEQAETARPEKPKTWDIDKSAPEDSRPFVIANANPPPATPAPSPVKPRPASAEIIPEEPKDQPSDNADNILPMASYVDQRASIVPYMTLFALMAIVFGLIAALSKAHPNVSASVLKEIPLVGPLLLKNNHLKEGILIRSLRSGYQSIQGNREVFVVTGVALNQNPVVIREIQITGKIFNDSGKELEQQTIWVGNTISPKIIRGMTSEDIPHLQNLKPLKSFEIPPGDSVPFTIVFLRSAKAAKDFTCQVVTAAAEA